LVAVRFTDSELTRPLAIIHRKTGHIGLTASRFLKLLTSEVGSENLVAAGGETGDRRAESKPA
jgi:hypothetical protein